jgi:hypothetical protein
MSAISAQPEKVHFDPGKVRFDLSLDEAFALTQVRSMKEYQLLRQRLQELRGVSYFFLNIAGGRARLMITIITAGDLVATSTFVLDHSALGMDDKDLVLASHEDGNYPVPYDIERKIRRSVQQPEWRFFKAE